MIGVSHRGEGLPMKSDYWNVSDEQVVEKTGKPLAHWKKVLAKFDAAAKKSNDVVAHLQNDHGVPPLLGADADHLVPQANLTPA